MNVFNKIQVCENKYLIVKCHFRNDFDFLINQHFREKLQTFKHQMFLKSRS